MVELGQTVQRHVSENKALQAKIEELQSSLHGWTSKHEEAATKIKTLQAEVKASHVLVHELEEQKVALQEKVVAGEEKLAEHEDKIKSLAEAMETQSRQMEAQSKIAGVAVQSAEDASVVATLKSQISSLREQLNRANALNALTKNRDVPTSPTALTAKFPVKNGVPIMGPPPTHNRRHSTAAALTLDHTSPHPEMDYADEPDDFSYMPGQRQRPASFTQADHLDNQKLRNRAHVSGVYDPEFLKIGLLTNRDDLHQDMIHTLVENLPIPTATPPDRLSIDKALFPGNIIGLVANEMWRYGLIQESRDFLAEMLNAVQKNLDVSSKDFHVPDSYPYPLQAFQGEDAIIPGVFWLSNVHEVLSFVCMAESDMLQGIGPGTDPAAYPFEWSDYENLISLLRCDLDSLESNIYHIFMKKTKATLSKMVVPALIETQSLPGFTTNDTGGRIFGRLMNTPAQPAYSMDDVLNLLNKVWNALTNYHVEESVVHQIVTELLKMIGVTSFNDLLMRRHFCSWKRGMQHRTPVARIANKVSSYANPI